jgi:hypothetical protein
MKTFLVERDLGKTPTVDLMGLSAASHRVARQMFDDGDRIYYLGSTYLPSDGLCMCLFIAKTTEVVAEHSLAAHLPVRRISNVVTFGAQDYPAVS